MDSSLPRKPRLHVPGGFYHVVARGNGKQDIFLDDRDRLLWEKMLGIGLQKHNHQIHAYCWMTNHVHIAIRAGEKPLAKFMSTLLSRYAKVFNLKTTRSGHVFERRYRAILVKESDYLMELVRYIHHNPLRAGIVGNVSDYRWSSHHAYMGKSRAPWLNTVVVLSLFGPNRHSARHQYVEFIGEEQPPSVIEQIRVGSTLDHRAFGDDEWLQEVLNVANSKPEFESLKQLIDMVCDQNAVTEDQLASKSRSRTNARLRAQIALVASDLGIATITEIARRFGRSQPVISRAVDRLRESLA